MEEKMDIFDLIVPLETNIKNANTQKMKQVSQISTQEDTSHHQIKQI